jgi:chaperone required for assembly of F1-ATPase
VKRFWKTAAVVEAEDGFSLALDGRPLKTPARATLLVPSRALAEEIAQEWRDCGEEIDPRAMPLTGLANAAIDRVAPDRDSFANTLARYAEADLFCYRAEYPPSLAARQAEIWDPLLGWARRRFVVDFAVGTGILHFDQPPATVERLAHALAALDPFRLAAVSPLVTIGGSLVAALGVVEGAIAIDVAIAAVSLDEQWQIEQWGADDEAVAVLEARAADLRAAARFVDLLRD